MVAKQLKPSRYNTRCRTCGCAIRPGDLITGGKGRSFCQHCSGGSASPKPDAPATPAAAAGRSAAEPSSDGVYRVNFQSLTEAVADAATDYAQSPRSRSLIQETFAMNKPQFWNHHSFDSLPADIRKPSETIMSAIEDMKSQLTDELAPTEPRRRRRHWCDAGDEIDVDRFLARRPECWDRFERMPQAKRTVTIGINTVCSYTQKACHLIYRGAAAVALADHLTQLGYSVGITLFNSARNVTSLAKSVVYRVELKTPDSPLDLASIASACCDIGITRLLGSLAVARRLPGKLDDGFGSVSSLPANDAAGFDFLVETNVDSHAAATRWLRDCVSKTTTELLARERMSVSRRV